MQLLRQYLWLWVVLVVLLLSIIIVLIFVCLSRWIRRQGKLILGQDRPAFVSERNQSPLWQQVPSLKLGTPPLPPRTQFMTEVPEAQSYENLSERPDYENPDLSESQPEYLQVEREPSPPYVPQPDDDDEDYDDIDKPQEDSDYDDVG